MIYTKDHEPMHVHVFYQGNEIIIEFEQEVSVRENNGMNRSQLRRASAIVVENRELLIESWRRIYE